MPTKRCCCNCVVFFDQFDRTDVGPNWEICTGDYFITQQPIPTNNSLTNVGDSKITLLRHVPSISGTNTYGILSALVKVDDSTVGVIYSIGAFVGTETDPCNGSPQHIAELEVLGPAVTPGFWEVEIRYDQSPGKPIRFLASGQAKLDLCVGKDAIIAEPDKEGIVITNGPRPAGDYLICCKCAANQMYFQLETKNGTGHWFQVNYNEHIDSRENPRCLRCPTETCYGNGFAIAGFEISVSGIKNGNCVSCPTSVSDRVIHDPLIGGPCDDTLYGFKEKFFNCDGLPTSPYRIVLEFSIICTNTDTVEFQVKATEFAPTVGECNSVSVSRVFPAPGGIPNFIIISESDGDCVATGFPGIGECDFGEARITAFPILAPACCYDPLLPPVPPP